MKYYFIKSVSTTTLIQNHWLKKREPIIMIEESVDSENTTETPKRSVVTCHLRQAVLLFWSIILERLRELIFQKLLLKYFLTIYKKCRRKHF